MAFSWVAVYKDGGLLHQIDPDTGSERSSERIDRAALSSFVLLDHDGSTKLVQHLDPGHFLIYRRRTERDATGATTVVHLVGWRRIISIGGGEPVICQHVAYAFESDGRVAMAGDWRDDHRWYYPIKLTPAEEVAVE